MSIDIVQLSVIAGAIITIISLAKLVVEPFQKAIKKNDEVMNKLQETIKDMSYEVKESQRDRDNIHKILDSHELRIGKTEDEIILNNERIKQLFKQTGGN